MICYNSNKSTYKTKKQTKKYGAEQAIINIFHFLMKYALRPVTTIATMNIIHKIATATALYFGPTSSPAMTNGPSTVAGLKIPTMKRLVANKAKFGENALRKVTTITP